METVTIFGIRAIIEAIQSDKPIDKVWILKGINSPLAEQLFQLIRSKNIAFSYVPIERLERFSEKNHQGAIARIAAIRTHEMESLVEKIMASKKNPVFVLLDGITDARNFGAILRTAAAVYVDALFIPISGSAPLNGDVVKTSAGGAFKVPISKVSHLKDVIFYLKANYITIYAITEKAQESLYQSKLKGPIALIFGSEDVGISSGLLHLADNQFKLPMQKNTNSLNVSVACGVVFYEVIRQRMK